MVVLGDKDLLQSAYEKIPKIGKSVAADYHRLKFHVMPPTGLLNDPNGFIHIYGEYHLFYQFNPFATNHGTKFWGHVKSKDLVNWEELPIALAPVEWYEVNGCYSGSAVNDNGVFTLIYTGNVKPAPGERETYQCIARSKDGVIFNKYFNNPVMRNQPRGYTRNFRDPKVWRHEGAWYMVIGAQTIDNEGRVLLFKGEKLTKWSLIGEVAGCNINGLTNFGYMWECPDLFNLSGTDVLLSCPQGLTPQGDSYNNVYQAGYLLGKLDYWTGKMLHGDFTELDRGFEFYAPQTTLDEKGRRILIAWMGMPEEEEHPTIQYNWIHAMTIPRVLELKDGKLHQKPVEEIELLRQDRLEYKDILLDAQEIQLPNLRGEIFEMELEVEFGTAAEFGVKLRASKDFSNYTVLSYNQKNGKITLNRNKSGQGYKGSRSCTIRQAKNVKVRIFSDASSLEVFINDGEEVFTSRIYPGRDSTGISFFAEAGSAIIRSVTKWAL